MRIGIVSPVVTRIPGSHGRWETDAGIEELAAIALAADRLGFDHLTCSEHVAVPVGQAQVRGGVYWDPLATFGYLAARTERIRLATHVLVLGYHHPLEIAKRYGTLDRVSGGRLVLGLGVGSQAEEFDLLGAGFPDRGSRADDSLAALRSSLGRPMPEYAGRYYTYSDLIVEPTAVQELVPLWIGGRTRRSLRRAIEFGDGWMPFGLEADELSRMLAGVEVPSGFDVVLSAAGMTDPIGRPAETRRALADVRDVGATIIDVRITADSTAHYCEQLAALQEIAHRLG